MLTLFWLSTQWGVNSRRESRECEVCRAVELEAALTPACQSGKRSVDAAAGIQPLSNRCSAA